MTFRTIGLVLCAAACVAGGWMVGERMKKAQKDLSYLLRLTEHLYTEIYYAHAELPMCFRSFREADDRHIAERMANGAYEDALRALAVPSELRRELTESFIQLGNGTLEEELLKIGRMKERLKNESESSAKKTVGGVRSARVLGICAGAAILLLFL